MKMNSPIISFSCALKSLLQYRKTGMHVHITSSKLTHWFDWWMYSFFIICTCVHGSWKFKIAQSNTFSQNIIYILEALPVMRIWNWWQQSRQVMDQCLQIFCFCSLTINMKIYLRFLTLAEPLKNLRTLLKIPQISYCRGFQTWSSPPAEFSSNFSQHTCL